VIHRTPVSSRAQDACLPRRCVSRISLAVGMPYAVAATRFALATVPCRYSGSYRAIDHTRNKIA
jgi:hypothetical protein